MKIIRLTRVGALALLAACSGDGTNPLVGGGSDPEGGAGLGGNLTFNEGTDLYTLQRVRVSGSELVVEGLPFDGDDAYADTALVLDQDTGRPVARIFFRNPASIDDQYTGDSDGPIIQDRYIFAIYNESDDGNAKTSVVRSGNYLEHGFGGYVVGRDTGVDLPTSGQANYYGNYVALRTFKGSPGIELVDGDMEMEVDFEKLEDNGAMRADVTGRRLYDAEDGTYLGDLPALIGTVQAGGIEDNGQFETSIRVDYYDPDATDVADINSEFGTMRGMFEGDSAETVVGVVDITMDSYHAKNGSVDFGAGVIPTYGFGEDTTITETRETGTFVLER